MHESETILGTFYRLLGDRFDDAVRMTTLPFFEDAIDVSAAYLAGEEIDLADEEGLRHAHTELLDIIDETFSLSGEALDGDRRALEALLARCLDAQRRQRRWKDLPAHIRPGLESYVVAFAGTSARSLSDPLLPMDDNLLPPVLAFFLWFHETGGDIPDWHARTAGS